MPSDRLRVPMRRRLWSLLRLLVAVGLTAYVLWRSDPRDVVAATTGADLRWLGLAVLLVIPDRALMAYRWLTLLVNLPAERRPRLWVVMRIFFVSTFVGTFLPASIGGDAVRAYSLARQNVAGTDAVASVLLDRAFGVLSLLLLGAVGLVIARDLANDPVIVVSLVLTTLACLGLALLIYSRQFGRKGAWLCERLPWRPGRQMAADLLAAIQRYAAHHRQLTNVLLCSVAVQGLRIAQAYCLGRSLDIPTPFVVYVAFLPLIILVMLLPVSMNGIGTSQAAFVWFFGRVGVGSPEAFALSVLFLALGVVGNLPGGLLFAWGGRQAPSSSKATEVQAS